MSACRRRRKKIQIKKTARPPRSELDGDRNLIVTKIKSVCRVRPAAGRERIFGRTRFRLSHRRPPLPAPPPRDFFRVCIRRLTLVVYYTIVVVVVVVVVVSFGRARIAIAACVCVFSFSAAITERDAYTRLQRFRTQTSSCLFRVYFFPRSKSTTPQHERCWRGSRKTMMINTRVIPRRNE